MYNSSPPQVMSCPVSEQEGQLQIPGVESHSYFDSMTATVQAARCHTVSSCLRPRTFQL
ncbi:hypothetical protein BDW75DRAFT_91633 [Aspergillus navahoensis]